MRYLAESLVGEVKWAFAYTGQEFKEITGLVKKCGEGIGLLMSHPSHLIFTISLHSLSILDYQPFPKSSHLMTDQGG